MGFWSRDFFAQSIETDDFSVTPWYHSVTIYFLTWTLTKLTPEDTYLLI